MCILAFTCKKKKDFMASEKGMYFFINLLIVITSIILGLIITTREVIELGHGVKMVRLG